MEPPTKSAKTKVVKTGIPCQTARSVGYFFSSKAVNPSDFQMLSVGTGAGPSLARRVPRLGRSRAGNRPPRAARRGVPATNPDTGTTKWTQAALIRLIRRHGASPSVSTTAARHPRYNSQARRNTPTTRLPRHSCRRPDPPPVARWPSRDPIGEAGGLNLYGFTLNDPVGKFDSIGLEIYPNEVPLPPPASPFDVTAVPGIMTANG